MFQDTEGPILITCGWEDRDSIRPHPPETFLMFYRREGASHVTGSCRIPYRLLCQIEELDILEVGCDFVPDSLQAFLA